MYKSQFQKVDPYDSFVVQGYILVLQFYSVL